MTATAGSSSLPGLDQGDIDAFTALYRAHLALASTATAHADEHVVHASKTQAYASEDVDPTAALEAFRARTPAANQPELDRLAQRLRGEFHAEQAAQRRAQLQGLLVQMPPFQLSARDYATRKTARARAQRCQEMRTFAKAFARRDNVGVHPFFAALRQVLEAQALDEGGRRLQWALDDAVLMEAGGDDFMQASVRMLKGVLHFDEHEVASHNPFLSEAECKGQADTASSDRVQDIPQMRIWTVAPHLSNPECRQLARCIPSHVVAARRTGSRPRRDSVAASIPPTRRGELVRSDDLARLYAASDDEERQAAGAGRLPLSTGTLQIAPVGGDAAEGRREAHFRGGWIEWLYGSLLYLFAK